MDLERISVVVRARDSWESVDLGFAMVKKWWRAIYAAWIVVVLPPAILLNIAFRDYPWVAFALIWWLKPLFDRLPLAIISRAFFGEMPTPWRIVTRPRQYLGRGLLGDLTLRRLSPWRTYVMPVAALEELTGSARSKRVGVFTEAYAGMGFFLTLICWIFEAFLFRGGFVLFLMFLPDSIDAQEVFGETNPALAIFLPEFIGLDGTGPTWLPLMRNVFHVAAVALVEPFFVAAGFALYINRRVELEGWDIELGFRRMAARLDKLTRTTAAILLVSLCAGGAAAQSQAPRSSDPDFAATIEEVLAAPEFDTKKKVEGWAPIEEEKPEDPVQLPDADFGFAGEVGQFLATVLVWSIGGLAVAMLLYLVVMYLRRDDDDDGRGTPRLHKPDSLFGLDLRPDSLPPDLLGAARRLWAAGDRAGAMSLLYRGALAHVVGRLRVDVPDSATEGECIEIVNDNLGGPLCNDFESLARAWQLVPYADREPTALVFDDLCQRWRQHLRPAA